MARQRVYSIFVGDGWSWVEGALPRLRCGKEAVAVGLLLSVGGVSNGAERVSEVLDKVLRQWSSCWCGRKEGTDESIGDGEDGCAGKDVCVWVWC